MNQRGKLIGVTLGAGLLLSGFQEGEAQIFQQPLREAEFFQPRPSRYAVEKAVMHQEFTDSEKIERMKVISRQAIGFFKAKDYEKAMIALEQLAELNPAMRPVNTVMAVWFEEIGDFDQMRRQLEAACQNDKEDPEAYLYLARFALSEKRVTEGGLLLGQAQQLLEKTELPEKRQKELDSLFYELLAFYSELRGDWESVLGTFQAKEKLAPEDVSLKIQLAQVFLRLNDTRTAAVKFAEARKLDASLLPPETMIAKDFWKRGDMEQVRIFLDAALKKYPEDYANLLELMNMVFTLHGTEAAKAIALKLDTLKPENTDTLRWHGEFYLAEGKLYDAYMKFSKAIEAVPQDINVSIGLIRTQLLARDPVGFQEAEELAAELARYLPNNADILLHYAWALKKNGQTERADQIVQELLKQWVPTQDAILVLAECLKGTAKEDAAKTLLEQALNDKRHFVLRSHAEKFQNELRNSASAEKTAVLSGQAAVPTLQTLGELNAEPDADTILEDPDPQERLQRIPRPRGENQSR